MGFPDRRTTVDMLVQRIMGTTFDITVEPPCTSIAKSKSTTASISKIGPPPVASFTWFVLVYNIAVILWGAYVRATGSGAGCGSRWPLCNGTIIPATAQTQTLIEFTHRVSSAVSLVLVMILLIWCRRRTVKGDWSRYTATAAAALLFNEALLGALLVLIDRIGGLDRSAAHAVFLCLHFGNTLLLLAALALTAKWLSSRDPRFSSVARPHQMISTGLGLVSVMVIGMTGSLASLGDTIFPSDSLRHALMQDFSASSHILLRLRLFHPVAAVVGSTYVFWLLWSLWRKQDHSPWMFILAAALITQIALGAMNVILLAPIWLQMMHLLVAEMVWILLVLASAELLLVEQLWWPCTRTDPGPTSEVASRSRLTVKPLPRMLCDRSFFRRGKGPACLLFIENRTDSVIYGGGSCWARRCYTEQRDKRRKSSSHDGADDIS